MKSHPFAKLGSLTSLISSGSTPLGGSARYLIEGPVMFIRSQNVRMNYLDLSDVVYIDSALHDEMKRTHVRSGDVFINITGASIGRVAAFDRNGDKANVNQHVCIIRPKSDQLDFRYLTTLLCSPKFQGIINSLQRGGTRQALTFEMIANFEIPLPPLPEQRRIASILDKSDAIQQKREEGIRLSEELLRSTFLEMFGDPTTNSKGWPLFSFDEVCDSRLGKMLDAKRQTGEKKKPYMRNFNVQWGRLDMSSIFEMDFDIGERDEFRLKFGDVLVCEGGAGVGQTAIWHDELPECYFQKSLHRLRPKPMRATSQYIASLMRFMMQSSSILGSISSATIPHLTGEKLKLVKIPLPPLELQKRFEQIAYSISKLSTSRKKSATEANALFDSLVQRAFRGEI